MSPTFAVRTAVPTEAAPAPSNPEVRSQVRRAWGDDGHGLPLLVGHCADFASRVANDLAAARGADLIELEVAELESILFLPPGLHGPRELGRTHVRLAGARVPRWLTAALMDDAVVASRPLVLHLEGLHRATPEVAAALGRIAGDRLLAFGGPRLRSDVLILGSATPDGLVNADDTPAGVLAELFHGIPLGC